eukprot:SAG11_NODE_210_length_12303_cov_10.235824_4_plen_135_part_00
MRCTCVSMSHLAAALARVACQLWRADTEFLKTIRDCQSPVNGDMPGHVPATGKTLPHGSDLVHWGQDSQLGIAARIDSHAHGPNTDISWSAAYPLITHWVFKYYGDEAVVKEHWPRLNLFINGLMENSEGIPTF